MQSNSPFSSRPPLPTPDGNVFAPDPTPIAARGDWKSAPLVVRGWAYILTWLSIVFIPIVMLAGIFDQKSDVAERFGGLFILSLCFALAIWLNRALKKGTRAAWTAQIVVSILGLLGFPLGTAIHAYILSQWFKPETKAWFGKN